MTTHISHTLTAATNTFFHVKIKLLHSTVHFQAIKLQQLE